MSSRILLICLLLRFCHFAIAEESPIITLKSVHDITIDLSIFHKAESIYTDILLSNETDFSSEIATVYSTGERVITSPDEIAFLVTSENIFTDTGETRLTIKLKEPLINSE